MTNLRESIRIIGRFWVPFLLHLTQPFPREVAESTFRFWHRLAENQKHFTLRLIDT
jgi:hypothetical protein